MNLVCPCSRLTWMNANQAFSKYFCQIPAHTCRKISNLAKNSRIYTLLPQWPYPFTIIPSREPAGIVTTPCTSPGQNITENLITLTQDLFQVSLPFPPLYSNGILFTVQTYCIFFLCLISFQLSYNLQSVPEP